MLQAPPGTAVITIPVLITLDESAPDIRPCPALAPQWGKYSEISSWECFCFSVSKPATYLRPEVEMFSQAVNHDNQADAVANVLLCTTLPRYYSVKNNPSPTRDITLKRMLWTPTALPGLALRERVLSCYWTSAFVRALCQKTNTSTSGCPTLQHWAGPSSSKSKPTAEVGAPSNDCIKILPILHSTNIPISSTEAFSRTYSTLPILRALYRGGYAMQVRYLDEVVYLHTKNHPCPPKPRGSSYEQHTA